MVLLLQHLRRIIWVTYTQQGIQQVGVAVCFRHYDHNPGSVLLSIYNFFRCCHGGHQVGLGHAGPETAPTDLNRNTEPAFSLVTLRCTQRKS